MNNFSALDTRESSDEKEPNLFPDQIPIKTAIYFE